MNHGTQPAVGHRCSLVAALGLMIGPVLAGCGSSGDPVTTGDGGVMLRDENNYTSVSSLTIPVVQTAAGVDLDVCWSDITTDILCHDLTPAADIDNVSFLQVLSLSQAEIQAKLAAGALKTSSVKTYRDLHTDHATTCTKLSALTFGGAALNPEQDYLDTAGSTYMLLFSKGTTPGSGARTMVFLQPSSSSSSTAVMAPDGCSSNILDFAADLITPKALAIPAAGPWVVDWSQISTDAMGGTVIFQNIDSLILGYYEGMTVSDLQTRFLDIDRIATSLYQMPLVDGARSADLAMAKDETGAAFSGFDRTGGVWAVALLCSSCQVPAPVALSILTPQ